MGDTVNVGRENEISNESNSKHAVSSFQRYEITFLIFNVVGIHIFYTIFTHNLFFSFFPEIFVYLLIFLDFIFVFKHHV